MPKIEVFIYLPMALVGTMGSIVASFVLSKAMPSSASKMKSTVKRKTVGWVLGIFLISWIHPFFFVFWILWTKACGGILVCELNLLYHLFVLFVVGLGFSALLRHILKLQEMSDGFS